MKSSASCEMLSDIPVAGRRCNVLNKNLIPTPLGHRREKIVVVQPVKPARLHLLWVVGRILHLAGTLVWQRFKGPLHGEHLGRILRMHFESMGCIWVKLGQILGMRRDLFSNEFCREMSKAQDMTSGFPGELAAAVLEEELGRPVERVFDRFDEAPIAAASIGQVHKARLREEGAWVVVKIRRPYIETRVAHELRYTRVIFHVLARLSIKPHMRWKDLSWELESVIREELDYLIEASSIRRMRKNLRRHGIHVPKVFFRYCTPRVLVMELIDGVFMSEYITALHDHPQELAPWLEENEVDPEKVGERLLLSLNRQMFEDNFFHADMHPGNIILLRRNNVALIDFGAVASLEDAFLQLNLLYMKAMAARNLDVAADILLLLNSPLPPELPVDEVKKRYKAIVGHWEGKSTSKLHSFHEKSVAAVSGELLKTLMEFEVPAEWAFLRLDRAHLTLDASMMFLAPQLDYFKVTRKYLRAFERRRLRAVGRKPPAPAPWPLPAAMEADDAPMMAGEWVLRQARSVELSVGKMTQTLGVIVGVLARALTVGGVLLTYCFLWQHHSTLVSWLDGAFFKRLQAFPELPYIPWLVLLGLVLYANRRATRLAKRLSRPTGSGRDASLELLADQG